MVDNSERVRRAAGRPASRRPSATDGRSSDKTQVGQTDFAPTVSKMESAEPDAVFYGGYIAEAAPLLKQMRDAGIDAPFVGGDGLYGADFGKAVGAAGEGAVVMCPCAPIDEESTFAADYEAEFGAAPGAYAAEGFDAMSVFLAPSTTVLAPARTSRRSSTATTGEGLSKRSRSTRTATLPVENVVLLGLQERGWHARARGRGHALTPDTRYHRPAGAAGT